MRTRLTATPLLFASLAFGQTPAAPAYANYLGGGLSALVGDQRNLVLSYETGICPAFVRPPVVKGELFIGADD